MAEFNQYIRDSFSNGVAVGGRQPRDAPFLELSRNARPTERGSEFPEWPEFLNFSLDWPFPQVFRGENATIVLGRDFVNVLSRAGAEPGMQVHYKASDVDTLHAFSVSEPWQAAVQYDSWYAAASGVLVFQDPRHASKVLIADTINVQCVCSYRDRLVLGGASGDWFSSERWQAVWDTWLQTQPEGRVSHDLMEFGSNWIAIGPPGGGSGDIPNYEFLAALGVYGDSGFDALDGYIVQQVETGQIDFAPLRTEGALLDLRQVGDRLAGFNTAGVTMFVPGEDVRLRSELTDAPGIRNRGAVQNFRSRLVWATPDSYIADWQLGDGIRTLDCREWGWFEWGVDAPLLATVDALLREFWFCNGQQSFIYNDRGVGGPIDILPTSGYRTAGKLNVIAGGKKEQYTVELRVNPMNFRERGHKRSQCQQCFMQGLDGAEVLVETLVGDKWQHLGWSPVNSDGVAFARVTGSDLRLSVRGTCAPSNRALISGIEERYNAASKRYRRGTKGEPGPK